MKIKDENSLIKKGKHPVVLSTDRHIVHMLSHLIALVFDFKNCQIYFHHIHDHLDTLLHIKNIKKSSHHYEED